MTNQTELTAERMAQITTCIVSDPAVEAVPRGMYDQAKNDLDTLKRNIRLEKGRYAREHREAVRKVRSSL